MTDMPGIDTKAAPSGTGCVDCEQSGSWWYHLRRCAECGHVGCCDSSPAQYATAHFRSTGHRYMQSFEPGEDWYWDYETESMLSGPALAEPSSRPESQPAPGPADRVPQDWQELLHR